MGLQIFAAKPSNGEISSSSLVFQTLMTDVNQRFQINTMYFRFMQTHKGSSSSSSSSVSSRAFSVSRLSSSTNCSRPLRLSSSSSLDSKHLSVGTVWPRRRGHGFNRSNHLNFIRLVQMSGGQKNATTSLEMAVSVVNEPHQIFVSRA